MNKSIRDVAATKLLLLSVANILLVTGCVFGDKKSIEAEGNWDCIPEMGSDSTYRTLKGFGGGVAFQKDTVNDKITIASIRLYSNSMSKSGPGDRIKFKDSISDGILYLELSTIWIRREISTPAFARDHGSYFFEPTQNNMSIGLVVGQDTSFYDLSFESDSVIVTRLKSGAVCLSPISRSNSYLRLMSQQGDY